MNPQALKEIINAAYNAGAVNAAEVLQADSAAKSHLFLQSLTFSRRRVKEVNEKFEQLRKLLQKGTK